ncbi:hypothetical protein ERO13_D07G119500v2 [Gossypium hirsutum]|uniref:Non-specific lipid transfer protein GPI-anchored 12 n=4 Tax=Gossypium TaxID=3633 RepID=A0ABM3AFF1_GOSHI|nr:non-specific lipid transfer protein GPI-anchored 12-like [Gossypium hirsutum]KAB2021275.1 hypothetical protein ES319_D07G128100v1 [Gossypium barbadense]KAG4138196.1 hypothetical protein ERO13_D07G119500v2 [Gossypium hirsutum]TYG61289.1 hypothetical protein ES288_D07G135700v1 [Gossypium darwinii]TYI73478.1 hypothetical protein E1A91_D07G131400v1 [Gossypium mustelinum]
MATKQRVTIVVATVFVLTFCRVATGQEPAAVGLGLGPSAEAPTADCFTNLLNLSDCLTFVEAGSNLTKPVKACCPELAGLVESSPQCLCNLLGKNATAVVGMDIDMKRALNLPTVCNVSTPPVTLCSVINRAPVAGPPQSEESVSPGGSPSNGNRNGAVIGLAFATAILHTLFGIY